MTTEEFSNEFDTLLNSYSNEYSINIDEYEKSIFLSHAQEEILLELYNGKNQFEDSFEGTEDFRLPRGTATGKQSRCRIHSQSAVENRLQSGLTN